MVEGFKTLVFGTSSNPDRYSNKAVLMLSNAGIPVVAFGLKEGSVSTVQIDTALKYYKNIHTITLYLNPKHQKAYYDYIIQLKPKRVIFNPGTENPIFYRLLRDANVSYEIACTLVLLTTNQYQS
jgi:predicted CoA-binding protein